MSANPTSNTITRLGTKHHIAAEALRAAGLDRQDIRSLPRGLVHYLVKLAKGSNAVAQRRNHDSPKHATERTIRAIQDLRAHRNAIEAALRAVEEDGDPQRFPSGSIKRGGHTTTQRRRRL